MLLGNLRGIIAFNDEKLNCTIMMFFKEASW
jgi:hypothetical protein